MEIDHDQNQLSDLEHAESFIMVKCVLTIQFYEKISDHTTLFMGMLIFYSFK